MASATAAPPVKPTTFPYKFSGDVVHASQYLVVWYTAWMTPYLVPEVAARLKVLLETMAVQHTAYIHELSILPTTVHMLVEVAPQVGIHPVIEAMKESSAGAISDEFKSFYKAPIYPMWTPGYFVATIGTIPPDLASFGQEQPPYRQVTKAHSAVQAITHRSQYLVVCRTKWGNECLSPIVARALTRILKRMAKENHAILLDIRILPDQFQMLVVCPPHLGIRLLIKRMKTASHLELEDAFAAGGDMPELRWEPGYLLTTIGDAPPEAIEQYRQYVLACDKALLGA